MDLSPQQEAILAEAGGTSSICVNAKAGTGKTTTMVLLAQAIDSSKKGVAVAFNRDIALELKARMPENFDCRTTHSAGLAAWRGLTGKYPGRANGRKNWQIWRELYPRQDAPKDLGRFIGLAKANAYVPRGAPYNAKSFREDWDWEWTASEHGLQLTDGEGDPIETKQLDEVLRKSIEWAWTKPKDSIDYDDMLYMPVVSRAPFFKFDVLIVDEAQDISLVQRLMFQMMLKPDTGRMIAVGDSNQAIYAFRGADHQALEQFKTVFGCIELPLTVSYRCPKAVVKEAQAYVPEIESAPDAPTGEVLVWDEWGHEDVKPGTAIICRNNKPIVDLCWKLLANGVGAKIRGREIGEGLKTLVKRAHVSDLKTLEQWLQWYEDQEFMRLKNAGKDGQLESFLDKMECIRIICANIGWEEGTVSDFNTEVDRMFADNKERPPVLLATVHKAKGLEWATVIFLDQHLIPSKFAKTPGAQQQERNLAYVAITRAKRTLVYATSDKFIDARDHGDASNIEVDLSEMEV